MKHRFHRALASVVLSVACLASTLTSPLLGQDFQNPAGVISVASVDRLLDNIQYLTRAAGTPQVGGLVNIMAGQYVDGLDTKRPVGLLIALTGQQPSAVAFVPVSDFDAILSKIKEVQEPQDVGGGIKKIVVQQEVFFRELDGWVFISDGAANLSRLPRDPAELLGELPQKYEIAMQLYVQRIPEVLRAQAVAQIRGGFERGLENASDDERLIQETVGSHGVDSLVSFVEESDRITLGWGVDSDQRTTYFEVDVTAVAGSTLAERLAPSNENKTRFAGFLQSDAAAKLHFISAIPQQDMDQAKRMLGKLRAQIFAEIDDDSELPDDASRRTAKDIVGSILDIFVDTIDGGTIDGGCALFLDNGKLQLVAGGRLADGVALEKELKRLVKFGRSIENNPSFDLIQFDVESYDGADFHTVTVPMSDEEEARMVFGDQLEVAVATAADSVYVALGADCRGLIRNVMTASASAGEVSATPASFELALGPVMKFAATIENKPELEKMAQVLEAAQGSDHISVTTTVIPRGVSYRLQIEEGVLRLIGEVAKMRQ